MLFYGFEPIVTSIVFALYILIFTINTSKIRQCVKQNIIGSKYLVKYYKYSKFMTNRVYLLAHEHDSDAIRANNRFICKITCVQVVVPEKY